MLCGLSWNIYAQDDLVLSDFRISVENIDEGLKLKCEHGCYWEELTFNVDNERLISINEAGTGKVHNHDEPEGDQFNFTLRK